MTRMILNSWVEGGSLDPNDTNAELERRLGYAFKDSARLELALTHSSRANEESDPQHGNERLEFLGDAVLDLVVSEYLMEAHPDADEGSLSRARADAVNTHALAARAKALGLGQAARLGRGEERSGGRDKPSILANVFEAVVGAMYLDGGLASVRGFVDREFAEDLQDLGRSIRDAKTQLQELLQARGEDIPRYHLMETRGPDHAREFEIEVRLGDTVLGSGQGRSKRAAEQEAARVALDQLDA